MPLRRLRRVLSPAASGAEIGPGVGWLFIFQVFNAMSFTLSLGAPMVLAARLLGGNEFHIGLLTALPTVMVALQLPAADLVDRVGFRRMMVWGWGLRTVFLLPIIPLPFLIDHVPGRVLIWAMIISMFLFNAIRGFAGGAWFPWLSALIPEDKRGRFLGLEQRVINLSAFLTLVLTGLFLGEAPAPWKFSVLFAFSAISGFLSVYYLALAPDAPPPPTTAAPRRGLVAFITHAPKVWAFAPFRRTVRFTIVYTCAAYALPAFLVLFQTEQLGWSEGSVLKLQALATLGVMVTSVTFGALSDRFGSRPLLQVADAIQFLFTGFWVAVAIGGWAPSIAIAAVAWFIWGVTSSAHAVAQMRLLLSCMPKGDITYGMALFQVMVWLIGGAAPVGFGWMLQRLRPQFENMSIGFGMIFAIALLLMAISLVLLTRVPDRRAVPTGRMLALVYDWPVRILSGIQDGSSRLSRAAVRRLTRRHRN